MIVRLLAQVLFRCPAARNDRLQEHRRVVLHEGHEVHAVMAPNDENSLTSVPLLVGMLDGIEQVASFDVEDDLLETDTALSLEPFVLRLVPGEVLHRQRVYHVVCLMSTQRRC